MAFSIKYILSVLLLNIITMNLNSINCLMIILNQSKEFCIFKDLLTNDVLKLSYVISGDENIEKSVNVKVYDKDKRILYDNSKLSHYLNKDDYEVTVNYKTTYSICFLSKKYNEVVASFEVYTMSESGHILSLAKDGKIKYFYNN